MSTSSTAQNTLELAKQGDPTAISIILTYYLSQQFNTTASAIRLGNYLSVLIDTPFTTSQDTLVNLVLSILQNLKVEDITVVEISARQMGDREVQWSQTIELTDSHFLDSTMTDLPHPDLPDVSTLEDADLEAAALARSANLSASANDDWDTALKTVFQRPELVALLAFALILVLWDAYTEWMEESSDLTEPWSGVRLARRLGISASTLRRVRDQTNFGEWSQALDPDGIAWSYENKVFMPRLN